MEEHVIKLSNLVQLKVKHPFPAVNIHRDCTETQVNLVSLLSISSSLTTISAQVQSIKSPVYSPGYECLADTLIYLDKYIYTY